MVATFTTFTAATEQDVVTLLDSFLQNHVGWYRADIISNTATDRDYVWVSDGEPDQWQNSNKRYIRVRATSDQLRFYAYSTYTNSSTFTGEIFNASNTVFGSQSSTAIITVIADKERVLLASHNSTGIFAPCYMGRLNSMYTVAQDPFPNAVRGDSSQVGDWHESTTRNQWYAYTPSSTLRLYKLTTSTGAAEAVPNVRNQTYTIFNQLLYSDASVGDTEIRGYVRGCYQISNRLGHFSYLTLASGTHLVYKGNDMTTAWAYGPLTDPRIGDYNRIPPVTATVDYVYRGFLLTGDVVVSWWRFDTDSLATVVDETGINNLTIVGTPSLVASPLNNALEFNGTSHYATGSGDLDVSTAFTGELTCEVLFMPNSLPVSIATLLEYGSPGESLPSDNTLLNVAITSNGNVRVSWEDFLQADIVRTTSVVGGFIKASFWNYLAVVKILESSTYRVEIWHASFGDHEPVLRQVFTGVPAAFDGENADWYVATSSSLTDFFGGKVDGIRISSGAFTREEVIASARRVRL